MIFMRSICMCVIVFLYYLSFIALLWSNSSTIIWSWLWILNLNSLSIQPGSLFFLTTVHWHFCGYSSIKLCMIIARTIRSSLHISLIAKCKHCVFTHLIHLMSTFEASLDWTSRITATFIHAIIVEIILFKERSIQAKLFKSLFLCLLSFGFFPSA